MICAASLLLASGAAGFSFGAAPGSLSLRAAQQSARTVAPRAVVLEISSQEEFDKALGSAGDSLVVIDYSTSWCGQCKNVAFLKVMGDSSPEADKLMRSQGVRALPSFHFWKGSKQVDSISGAKAQTLQDAIETHMN